MQKVKDLVKKFFGNIYVQNIIIMMGMGFSFLILDIGLRYFSNKYVLAYKFTHASPNLFSVSWILLFIMIFYLFSKKKKVWFYGITVGIFNILTIAQILHMKVLGRFFGLSDVLLASEGSDYFLFALKKIDLFTCLLVLLSVLSMVVTCILIKRFKEFDKNIKYYLCVLGIGVLSFSLVRFVAIDRLGTMAEANSWEAAYNVKNIYIDFNNQSKNMEVAGLYEQTFRNSYLFVKDLFNVEKDKINKELDDYFKSVDVELMKNKYTGTFKDKNLIFVLLESVDSWLVNEEVMPTLTRLSKEGWNFTNRYAPTFGGGQTINSEFSANTGLYAIDNSKAIYNFDKNLYPYSMASLFNNEGYSVNSIHANTAKFYNRSNFHIALGYDKHYALSDMKELDSSYDYFLDSSLVKNEEVFEFITSSDKFMSFITTYSPHLPYDSENINCGKNLYGLDDKKIGSELSCINNLAHDTDEFLRLLIEKLDDKKILDDTVLVLFTDHYMYGYSDVDYILEEKDVDNMNLIQNVPFVIWSNDIKSKKIDTIMDTSDILPTVVNLFGIEYNPKFYVGTDVFSESHEEFVYFANSVFYDGELYYDGKSKITKDNKEYIENTLEVINKKMWVNRQIILGDYFRYLDK